MLLIVTNSMDGTTDLLLPYLQGKKEVFRFNVDMWSRYTIEINEGDFIIVDPIGRRLSEDSCTGLYMRKAYFLDEDREKPIGGDIETWCQHQIRSIVDAIYWICYSKDLVRLVERNADRRLPKIVQMRHARKYFSVPRWTVSSSPGESSLRDPVVCKSLGAAFIGGFQSLFTTKCELADLDNGYPWFLQSYVEADGDLTALYANNRIFCFYRKRNSDEPIDYRQLQDGQDIGWSQFEPPFILRRSIHEFMRGLGLRFGRIDFLLKDNDYFFLEVNPNGQFAWLDPSNTTGMLSWIAECISL